GAAPPRGLPGRDLLAAGAEAPAISETLYGIMPDGATTPIVSLRTADWKLIHAPALGRYELYDLRRDPAEREDRFASAAEGGALAAPWGARRVRLPRRAARRHRTRGVARGARPEPAPRLDRHAARRPPGRVRLRAPDQPHDRRAPRRRGRDLRRRVQPVAQDHAVAHDALHVALPVGARRRAVGEREAGARPQPGGAHPGRGAEERRLRDRRLHGRRADRPGARLRPGLRPLHRGRTAAARAPLARAPSLGALLRLLPHLRCPRSVPAPGRVHPPLRPGLPRARARRRPPPARA